MKQKWLKVLVLLGCLTLTAGVAACGDKGGNDGGSSASRSEESSSLINMNSSSESVSSGVVDSSSEDVGEGNNESDFIEMESSSAGQSSSENQEGNERQVPVYQRMTISATKPELLTVGKYAVSGVALYAAGNGNGEGKGNNGNHYGWHKGDCKDEEEFDKDNPFPDNGESDNIESEIENSLTVEGAEKEIYYAEMNQDIYINVHISNPENFEILSFTLNGKKYSSYMFEDGSDMETLILKYNVGDVSGLAEYTIDQIKYIDGEQIKDVVMGGEQTVTAGIRREGQVTAAVSDVAVDFNQFTFDVEITDDDGLIAFSEGVVKAVLYDGNTLVATKDLQLGANEVVLDGLKTNVRYQYAIVGCYDAFVDGFGVNVLYKDAFKTKAIVMFDNITVSQESISFAYYWDESVLDKTITVLTLYKGEEVVEMLSADALSADNLQSNTEYTLIAEYKNGEMKESICLDFATASKALPTVAVAKTEATNTSIAFSIDVTDTDSVGAITKIELVSEDGVVEAENLDVREFGDLSVGKTYAIRITYTYNLNDGVGTQELVVEEVFDFGSYGLQYEQVGETYTVVGIGACTDTEICIPKTYQGLPVTAIGDYAFSGCDSLTEIVIPDSVTRIGDYAFRYCRSLTIYCEAESKPNGWDSDWTVYSSVVWDCRNNDVAEDGCLYKIIDGIRYALKDGVAAVVGKPRNITTVNIPETVSYKDVNYTVTSIGEEAFASCGILTEIVIPDSVTSIGHYAFNGCRSLTEIVIPDSVTSIGSYAFYNCNSLTIYCETESKPEGWASEWNYHGYNFYYPVVWDYRNNDVAEDGYIYTVVDAVRYSIKDGVAAVVGQPRKITTANIPETVSYKDVNYTVTSIGDSAFYGCNSLTEIVIPDSVTSIGRGAFSYCSNLTEIVIPDSVTSIGYEAFYNCYNLTIYSEAESQPDGWDSNWNYFNRPVYWYSENEPTESGNYWHYNEQGEIEIWN